MQSHKDLNVWKYAIDLAEDIYRVTKDYPREELFAMVSQMRRAVTSISMNIAEGYARGSERETIHFLYISSGSASELDTQIILSQRFGYIDKETAENLSNQTTVIRKMLSSLISSVKRNNGLTQQTTKQPNH